MGKKEKRIIESILFSTTKPISLHDIKKTTGLSLKIITEALNELINDYNITRKNETSVEIVKAGTKYTMQVKKRFFDSSIAVAKPEIQNY